MKPTSAFAKLVFALALTAIIIGLSALSQKPNGDKDSFRKEQSSRDTDTSRSGKHYRIKSYGNLDKLDIEMKHLDIQMKKLDEEMKDFDIKIDQKEIDEVMKKIDVEKISAEIDKSIKDIDWTEINKNIKESVAKADKVQMEEVKKQMENVKIQLENQKNNLHFEAPKIDAAKIKSETEKAMKDAKKSIEKAKEEIKNMKEFTNALQNDGLIDKSKAYRVEVRDGQLYINGKKQTKEVSDKYRKYYKKDNFTIDTNNEDDTEI